jgi:hypothetical protein
MAIETFGIVVFMLIWMIVLFIEFEREEKGHYRSKTNASLSEHTESALPIDSAWTFNVYRYARMVTEEKRISRCSYCRHQYTDEDKNSCSKCGAPRET